MKKIIAEWLENKCENKLFCSLLNLQQPTAVLLYGNRFSNDDFYGAVSEAPLNKLENTEYPWVQSREGWVLLLIDRKNFGEGGVLRVP